MRKKKEKRKENLARLMEEVKSNAWIRNTIKNYPNLTTLFLPNGVFRAKPRLKLTLKLSKKPPFEVQS